jgi:hypothetical protein
LFFIEQARQAVFSLKEKGDEERGVCVSETLFSDIIFVLVSVQRALDIEPSVRARIFSLTHK